LLNIIVNYVKIISVITHNDFKKQTYLENDHDANYTEKYEESKEDSHVKIIGGPRLKQRGPTFWELRYKHN